MFGAGREVLGLVRLSTTSLYHRLTTKLEYTRLNAKTLLQSCRKGKERRLMATWTPDPTLLSITQDGDGRPPGRARICCDRQPD